MIEWEDDIEYDEQDDSGEFMQQVVDAAMGKTLLELQVHANTTPTRREQAMIRAAIGIGASEAMMQLKARGAVGGAPDA